MSPSLSADRDPASLSGADFGVAAGLHLAVLLLFVILGLRVTSTQPEPPRSVEVQLVQSHPIPQPAAPPPPQETKPEEVKPPAKAKPEPKPMPKAEAAVKPTAVAKPKAEAAVKPKAEARPKEPMHAKPSESTTKAFDPFTPLASVAESRTRVPQENLAASQRAQLSAQEIDRYIARIRDAVQKQWRVPADLGNMRADPEVEMTLNPDGSVKSVAIILPSGSQTLDDSLLRAIEKAQPFTIPREQFEVFRTNRIRFHPIR